MNRVLAGAGTRISLLCMMAALIAAPSVCGQTAGGSSDTLFRYDVITSGPVIGMAFSF